MQLAVAELSWAALHQKLSWAAVYAASDQQTLVEHRLHSSAAEYQWKHSEQKSLPAGCREEYGIPAHVMELLLVGICCVLVGLELA